MKAARLYLVVNGTQHVIRPTVAAPFVSEGGKHFHIVRETLASERARVPLCGRCRYVLGERATSTTPRR